MIGVLCRAMEGTKRVSLISALVAAQLLHALALPITAPAFLWSPHNHGYWIYLVGSSYMRLCNSNHVCDALCK